MKCTILPPLDLLQPLHVPPKLLMGPGPSNCSPRVLNAMSQPMLGHMDKDFMNIMNEVKRGIQYVFQTKNEMTFAVSGTGHCAMETAIINVVEPDDTFLVASSGIWGDRAYNIGQRLGAHCHQIKIPGGESLCLDDLKAAVLKLNPKVVFLCHGDSSTGVLQPLSFLPDLLKSFNCIIIVDAVASLCAAPIFMDEWGIDVLYSGSQKILSSPPGLSPISFSSNAIKKITARKSLVPSFYMDALLIGNYWKCYGETAIYHHTAPISLMYALRESLSIIVEETLEKCWDRHKLCATKLQVALEDMGLVLYVSNKVNRLPSVTTVLIPTGIMGQNVVKDLQDRYNIDIAGGLGTTAGKVWRIGLMGYNCTEKNVSNTVNALKNCIEDSKLRSFL